MEQRLREPHGIPMTAARSRFTLVWLLAGCYWAISGFTRAAVYARALALGQTAAADAVSVFTVGAVYDAIAALFLTAPLALYLLLVPRRIFARRSHRSLLRVVTALAFFGKDVLATQPGERHALLNHNRDITLYAGGELHELGFRRSCATLSYDPAARRQLPARSNPEGTRDAAAIFQLAYDLYRSRQYRIE